MGRARGGQTAVVGAAPARRNDHPARELGFRTPEEERLLIHIRRMGFKQAYTVGGCERDRVRGITPKDFDISVAGHTLEDVLARAGAVGSVQQLEVAGQVIGVRLTAPWTPPEGIEIALARTEASTGGGRHAFAIRADPSIGIQEDLLRRDFSCNAMARCIYSGELIDPLGGAADIEAGVLRTVSEHSFPEDPLRVLRGIARCAKDGLRPDQQTAAQMREWAEDPKRYLRASAATTISELVRNGERDPENARDAEFFAVLREADVYSDEDGLDETRLQAWAATAVDQQGALDPSALDAPGRTRRFFEEHVTGYRWYGDVPLSPERIYDEMNKTLSGDDAADALRVARDVGALPHLVPELTESIGFQQHSKYHDMTVDEHTLLVLQRACEGKAPASVRWAALTHDSGKPATAWGWVADQSTPDGWRAATPEEWEATPASHKPADDNHLHFYGRPPLRDSTGETVIEAGRSHEEAGAERARDLFNRLAADKETKDKVVLLDREHMYTDDDGFLQLNESAQARRARRFIRRVGHNNLDELLLLRRCDRAGKRAALPAHWDSEIAAFESSVRQQLAQSAAVSPRDLALDGHALRAAGFDGPMIGEAQRQLLDIVVENPAENTSQRLLTLAAELREGIQRSAAELAATRKQAKDRKSKAAAASAAA